jgi:molybdopterin converting factor small subunit
MARVNAILKYGLTTSIDVDVSEGTTIAAIRRNPTYSIQLRLPENVVAVVNGLTVDNNYTLEDGDEVVFERQAATKAAKGKKIKPKPKGY